MPELNLSYEKFLRRLQNGSINQINKAFTDMILSLTRIISISPIHDPKISKALQREVLRVKREFVNRYNDIQKYYNGKAISISQRKNLDQIKRAIQGLEVKTGLVKEWLGRPNDPKVKIVAQSVWNINKGFYKNLDLVLKTGLLEGQPANVVKLQLNRLLKEPSILDINELRRLGKIRAGGEAAYNELQKKVLDYKPGRGIYKSSKKNAFRLARTEINRAYRQQDTDIRERLPFVIGIEVKLSAAHPRFDICDDMKGPYPKDYNFLGWHPACICYSVPILATKDQAAKLIANKPVKVNNVKNIPKRATKYIKDRKENINNYKTTPFFIDENKKYFKDLLK